MNFFSSGAMLSIARLFPGHLIERLVLQRSAFSYEDSNKTRPSHTGQSANPTIRFCGMRPCLAPRKKRLIMVDIGRTEFGYCCDDCEGRLASSSLLLRVHLVAFAGHAVAFST